MNQNKSKLIISISLSLLLLFSIYVNGYDTYNCKCYDNELSGTGSTQEIREENCGRACGVLTHCPTEGNMDCNSCCEGYCNFAGLESNNAIKGCGDSCVKTCKSKKTGIELYETIKLIAIIFASVIFAVCGILFLISDNPESRNKSKGCIFYVIIGLIVVGLSTPLIDLIYKLTLPGGVGPGTSCASIIGDAIVKCYDGAKEGIRTFRYPCENIDPSLCEKSVTEDDVVEYLNSIGRKDITGAASPTLSKINWKIGTITSEFGDYVCIKAIKDVYVSIDIIRKSDDIYCISKEQIDEIGYEVKNCWDSNKGSDENVVCSKIDVSDWPDDVKVEEDYIKYYLYFHGDDDTDVDFKSGSVTNRWAPDKVCVKYDTFFFHEVFVIEESEDNDCISQ